MATLLKRKSIRFIPKASKQPFLSSHTPSSSLYPCSYSFCTRLNTLNKPIDQPGPQGLGTHLGKAHWKGCGGQCVKGIEDTVSGLKGPAPTRGRKPGGARMDDMGINCSSHMGNRKQHRGGAKKPDRPGSHPGPATCWRREVSNHNNAKRTYRAVQSGT